MDQNKKVQADQQHQLQQIDTDLIKGLTEHQVQYVASTLFPTLREAIKQFMIEAQRSGHYQDFLKIQGLQSNAQQTNYKDPFKGYAYKANGVVQNGVESAPNFPSQDQEAKKSVFGNQRLRSGSVPLDQNLGFQNSFNPIQKFQELMIDVQKQIQVLGPETFNTQYQSPIKPNDAYFQNKRRSVFSKPYSTVLEMEEFIPPVHQKTQEQTQRIIESLRSSFLTKNLSQFELKIIADAMYLRKFERNDLIIRYGDLGHEYFILDKGHVEVIVYQEGTDPKDTDLRKKIVFSKFLPPGTCFGEIALLYNDKRTASIRSAIPCEVWALEGRVFKNIIIKSTIKRRNIELSFLDKVDMFENLERYEKLKLIDGLEPRKYLMGNFIFKEGEQGDYFYIIEDGEVECLKDPLSRSQSTASFSIGAGQTSTSEFIVVRELKQGDHFGELALLNDTKRSLSIRVKSPECKILCLNADSFKRILGDINKYLRRNYDGEFDNRFANSMDSSWTSNRGGSLNIVLEETDQEYQDNLLNDDLNTVNNQNQNSLRQNNNSAMVEQTASPKNETLLDIHNNNSD
eukprot:403343503